MSSQPVDMQPPPERVDSDTLHVVADGEDLRAADELALPVVMASPDDWCPEWAARLAAGRRYVYVLPRADRAARETADDWALAIAWAGAETGVEAAVVELHQGRVDGVGLRDVIATHRGAEGARLAIDVAARAVRPVTFGRVLAAVPEPVSLDPAERAASTGRRVTLTVAAAIPSERLRWLEVDRFPLRALTAVAGEKGLGKSVYTNAYLAAAVTRGGLAGEYAGHQMDVAVLTAEDDWRSIVKPRLMAHGADLSRVHRVTVADGDAEDLFTLPRDVDQLGEAVERLRDDGHPVALVVIDPIGAFIPETTNSHADAPVRRALAPLAQLADRLDLAVAVVMHLNKDDTRRLIQRVSGAGAFVNVARSVLAFVRHPDDPDGEQGRERVIVQAAGNWSPHAASLAVRVEGRLVDTDDGGRTDVGYLVVLGETTISVEDVQGQRNGDSRSSTEDAIAAELADGARPSLDVKDAVAKRLGCSHPTVERAAHRLAETGDLEVQSGGWPRRTTWQLAQSHHALPPPGDATEATRMVEPNTGLSDISRITPGAHEATDVTDATGPPDETAGWAS